MDDQDLMISNNCMLNRVSKAVNTTPQISSQLVGPRGSAVERQSLASVLSPSCARPVADG